MSRSHVVCAVLYAGISTAAWGYSTGADPRLTGAPGDSNCTACHSGTALNKGGGSILIILAGDATYVPGVKQRITVKVADPAQKRWGFELTARLNSSPGTGQAGTLAAADGTSQVLCDKTSRNAPCSSATVVQFATHTTSGTRLGTTGGVSFLVDWTPPATDVGPITLYAAGNAANGNNNESGDHIYTTSIQLTAAVVAPATAVTNVVSNASGVAGTAPASWLTINGTALANSSRIWTAAEAAAGLPTSLDGVSVQVNGNAAFVQSISPTQLVVLTPSDTSTGPVGVVVNNNGTASAPFSVTMAATAPALLVGPDNHYLITSHGASPLAGRVDNFPAASLPSPTAALAGETISFYGTGFGPVTPAITDGVLQAAAAPLTSAYTLTMGGETAQVAFAGLAPGFAGIYQFTAVVPADLAAGDQPVVITMGNQTTQSSATCCFLAITATPSKPVITSTVSAASQLAGTAPGSWIAINGADLANTTRTWTAAEAAATNGLPTSLDGVSVTVNNIAAFVQAVSPTLLIVITPSDTTIGQITVQVTNNGLVSDPSTVTMAALAPALFTADGKYLVTTHGANVLDTRLDVYPATPGWPAVTWPAPVAAAPGETISFYGTGFGATDTPVVDGQLQVNAVNATTPYGLTIGGETAAVSFAGLAPGFAGIFQFTATIPADLPNGDQPVVISIGGLSTPQSAACCFVNVQSPSANPGQ